MRMGKRQLIADGLIMDPATRPERYVFHWTYEESSGTVYADNTGDARSLIKKSLGITRGRLPKEVRIVRAPNLEHSAAVEQSCANLQARLGQNQSSESNG